MRHLDVVQPKDLFSYACPEDVGAMPASGPGHFCGTCQKVVVDLSCATFEQAVDTIRNATKSTCVSYAVDASGGLLFRDRLHGAKLVTVAAFLAACSSPAPEAKPPTAAHHDVAAAQVAPTATSQVATPTSVAVVAPPPAHPSTPTASWPGAVTEPPPPRPPTPVTEPVPPPPRRLAGAAPPRPVMLSGEPMMPPPPAPPPQTLRGKMALPDDVQ